MPSSYEGGGVLSHEVRKYRRDTSLRCTQGGKLRRREIDGVQDAAQSVAMGDGHGAALAVDPDMAEVAAALRRRDPGPAGGCGVLEHDVGAEGLVELAGARAGGAERPRDELVEWQEVGELRAI